MVIDLPGDGMRFPLDVASARAPSIPHRLGYPGLGGATSPPRPRHPQGSLGMQPPVCPPCQLWPGAEQPLRRWQGELRGHDAKKRPSLPEVA